MGIFVSTLTRTNEKRHVHFAEKAMEIKRLWTIYKNTNTDSDTNVLSFFFLAPVLYYDIISYIVTRVACTLIYGASTAAKFEYLNFVPLALPSGQQIVILFVWRSGLFIFFLFSFFFPWKNSRKNAIKGIFMCLHCAHIMPEYGVRICVHRNRIGTNKHTYRIYIYICTRGVNENLYECRKP